MTIVLSFSESIYYTILDIFTGKNAFLTFLMKMWPLSQDFSYNFSRHFMMSVSILYNPILWFILDCIQIDVYFLMSIFIYING